MANNEILSPDLLKGIFDLVEDATNRELYASFARLIRSSSLSAEYDDATIISGIHHYFHLGEKESGDGKLAEPGDDHNDNARTPPELRETWIVLTEPIDIQGLARVNPIKARP